MTVEASFPRTTRADERPALELRRADSAAASRAVRAVAGVTGVGCWRADPPRRGSTDVDGGVQIFSVRPSATRRHAAPSHRHGRAGSVAAARRSRALTRSWWFLAIQFDYSHRRGTDDAQVIIPRRVAGDRVDLSCCCGRYRAGLADGVGDVVVRGILGRRTRSPPRVGFAVADPSFPLFTFVFLVALGIDYNIFLMESRPRGGGAGTAPGAARCARWWPPARSSPPPA